MKTSILTAVALLAASPALAQVIQPRIVDTDPVVPGVTDGTERAVTLVRGAGQNPVLISGDAVISAEQPLDLNLSPIPGLEFGFINEAGQIVIVAPANRSIQYFDN
jgi:hypothetical protein